jgi:hypothetical protein
VALYESLLRAVIGQPVEIFSELINPDRKLFRFEREKYAEKPR